jgi:hypothetical protein
MFAAKAAHDAKQRLRPTLSRQARLAVARQVARLADAIGSTDATDADIRSIVDRVEGMAQRYADLSPSPALRAGNQILAFAGDLRQSPRDMSAYRALVLWLERYDLLPSGYRSSL